MPDAPVIMERRSNTPSSHDCKQDATIIVLQKALDAMNIKLDQILQQITKVAVLEANHQSSVADINRAHKYVADLEQKCDNDVEKMEKSIEALSIETREFINQTKGFNKAIWFMFSLIGGTTMTLLIKILFFMGSHGATLG